MQSHYDGLATDPQCYACSVSKVSNSNIPSFQRVGYGIASVFYVKKKVYTPNNTKVIPRISNNEDGDDCTFVQIPDRLP